MKKNLSENAEKLFSILKTAGGWEGQILERMFPGPKYERTPEAQRNFWQWEANLYGHKEYNRPVGGQSVIFNATENHYETFMAAWKELREAGLVASKNNGFNEYWMYAKAGK